MIKLIIYFFLNTLLFHSVKADINSINVLKHRLEQINNSYIYFIQKKNTIDGVSIETSQGELWIKQPNLFHCHIIDPVESFLISDGTTIWFYVPILKQVTAYNFPSGLSNNIFLSLLFNANMSIWGNYDIVQQKDWFYIKPIFFNNFNLKKYKIKINAQGIIDQLTIIEPHNQYINYYLCNQHIELTDISKFQFIISPDVQLDDQR